MAALVVSGYPDEATAQRAYQTARDLERDLILQLAPAAVVRRTADGTLNVETPTGATGAGATGCALWAA